MGILHDDIKMFLLCQAKLAEYLFKQKHVFNKSDKEKCTNGQSTFTVSLTVYKLNEQELLHYVYLSKQVDSTASFLNTRKDYFKINNGFLNM